MPLAVERQKLTVGLQGLGVVARRRFPILNQSQSGIYIDTGLGSATNTVIPVPAGTGIQGTLQNVLSWTLLPRKDRCDEGFCSFRLRKLTHYRLPKQTLGFSLM